MGLLNRDGLLKKEKLEIKKIDVGKGDHVYIRQLTGKERDDWEKDFTIKIKNDSGKVIGRDQKLEGLLAKLLVRSVCDKDGNLLLKPEDHSAISENMSAKRLNKIVEAAQELNGITEKDKEELVKN